MHQMALWLNNYHFRQFKIDPALFCIEGECETKRKEREIIKDNLELKVDDHTVMITDDSVVSLHEICLD